MSEKEGDHGWLADAACRGMAPAMFYPARDEDAEAALAVCATCPVRENCKADALAAPREAYGIWGGMTERDRARFFRTTRRGKARRTHCSKEHELAGDNVYVTADGRLECRLCRRIANQEWAKRKKEANG